MSKYFERLCGLVRKAIVQYDMIQDGDKVCVGVSGGKDSVALTLALAKVQKYINVKFDMVALTLDPRFFSRDADFSSLEKLCGDAGIAYVIKRTDIGPIIFDERKEDNPCSLCARMRRGALHDMAKELGCNKIALGHHLDDAIETFYMNLWNEGKSSCPMDGVTNRQRMKDFITDRCRTDPSFRKKSLNAFQKKDLDGWGIKKVK